MPEKNLNRNSCRIRNNIDEIKLHTNVVPILIVELNHFRYNQFLQCLASGKPTRLLTVKGRKMDPLPQDTERGWKFKKKKKVLAPKEGYALSEVIIISCPAMLDRFISDLVSFHTPFSVNQLGMTISRNLFL